MSALSCLVVGLGSIGERHRAVLTGLGHRVATVSRRGGPGHYPDLAAALAAGHPDYVVIATETADHRRALATLAGLGYRGRVLVEKPLSAEGGTLPHHGFADLRVAYNLRRHPGLRRLKEWLGEEPVISAEIYVGQYLPGWRPDRDYRTGYSARRDQGGGALRDLSHELDYAQWLLGPWRRVAALGGTWSSLEIDSDDCCVMLASFARCRAATLHLNYLDRQTRRTVVLNTDRHSYHLDFIAGTVGRDREAPERCIVARDDTYRDLHRTMLEEGGAGLCDALGGQRVDALILAAERAARENRWVGAEEFAEAENADPGPRLSEPAPRLSNSGPDSGPSDQGHGS